MILAADIGGTKSLLGLFSGGQCLASSRYTNADFANFSEVLGCFRREQGDAAIRSACLALAGPVAQGARAARLTNLPWLIDAAELEHAHGLSVVRLVNDFAAAAMGAVRADRTQLTTVNAGIPLAGAPCVVLGAGTGLGVALALPRGDAWQIVPGEGGHTGFAPADAQQLALWQFLHQRQERVTWERVVSGPGLAAIHEFLGGAAESPEVIGAQALSDPGSLSGRALDLFLAAYGAFAGDMALATLARGGVYLAGGIAAKVLPRLVREPGPFRRAFAAKDNHSSLMPAMPVHVVTDPLAGLCGAAFLAGPDC